MEMIVLAVGMVAAFFLGAYVRLPFAVVSRTESQRTEPEAVEEPEDGQLTEAQQLANLLNYNGDSQDE